MYLSIIIPTFNEAANIVIVIDKVRQIFEGSNFDYEIIVADAGSKDGTFNVANGKGVKAFVQKDLGYGGALREAIKSAQGEYIITMDADLSHNPYIIKRLFSQRFSAHVIIASRYVKGGMAIMPFTRKVLSTILNKALASGLSLPVKDLSSGFRLYNAQIFKEIEFLERDFNVLVEIVAKAYMNGFTVKEIPFHYHPRKKGKSNAKIIKFGFGFLRTFFRMWKMRNTINAADYDDRAFYSRIPLQRFWNRQRYKIIYGFIEQSSLILDVGCGTSKILGALPQAIGLDIDFKKLRYNNYMLGNRLVNADLRNLCFKDDAFEEIICSEVIEHLEEGDVIFYELNRVLKKGGILILGTPDYSRFSWLALEWLYKKIVPNGYADQHISRYTRSSLVGLMEKMGFKLLSYKYIFGSELICKFTKI